MEQKRKVREIEELGELQKFLSDEELQEMIDAGKYLEKVCADRPWWRKKRTILLLILGTYLWMNWRTEIETCWEMVRGLILK